MWCTDTANRRGYLPSSVSIRVRHAAVSTRRPSGTSTLAGGALLEPLADRGRMNPGHLGDLDSGPALKLECVYVHVLLLVHHEPGGPFSCRAWSLDTLEGPPPSVVDGDQARRNLITRREFA